MKGFTKQRHNPVELIKQCWPDANTDHITYDPDMKKGDYDIIRQCGHDGTLLFTTEMIQKCLVNIASMVSCSSLSPPDKHKKLKAIKYTVGTMRHATVFGMIKLRCSKERKYLGLRERVKIPVKCEYIYWD